MVCINKQITRKITFKNYKSHLAPIILAMSVFGKYLVYSGAVSYTHLDVYKRQAYTERTTPVKRVQIKVVFI